MVDKVKVYCANFYYLEKDTCLFLKLQNNLQSFIMKRLFGAIRRTKISVQSFFFLLKFEYGYSALEVANVVEIQAITS